MKNVILLFAALVVLSGTSFGQAKNIEAGIKAFEARKYEQAMKEFDTGLADPGSLKSKVLAKGYYHRAKARMMRLNTLRGDEYSSDDLKAYTKGLVQDLEGVKKNDGSGNYEEDLKVTWANAKDLVLRLASETLPLAADKNITEKERISKCEKIIHFCDAAIGLDEYDYTSYQKKGRAYQIMGEGAKALQAYNMAAEKFYRSAPKIGDLSIGYTFIKIAELELEVNKDAAAARAAIKKGKERLEGENTKMRRLNVRPAEKAARIAEYDDALKDIKRYEGSLPRE